METGKGNCPSKLAFSVFFVCLFAIVVFYDVIVGRRSTQAITTSHCCDTVCLQNGATAVTTVDRMT